MQLLRQAAYLGPAAIIHCGDIVERGERKDQWIDAFKTLGLVPPWTDFLPCPGNHDLPDNGYQRHFPTIGLWYSRDFGSCRVISLNAFDPDLPLRRGQQWRWLLRALQSHTGPKIVFFHLPLFSPGIPDIWMHGSNLPLRAVLHPLFVQERVNLVLCGHEHLYYRTVQDDVWYIISGGGGGNIWGRRPLNTTDVMDVTILVRGFTIITVQQKLVSFVQMGMYGAILDGG